MRRDSKSKTFLLTLAIIFFCLFVLSSGKLYSQGLKEKAPKGKEKTIADNKYGSGGTKTTFTIGNTTIDRYADVNKNRREFNISISYNAGNIAKTISSTYFNSQEKKEFVKAETFDRSNKLIQELKGRYSPNNTLVASTWRIQNGTRTEYNFNAATNRFIIGKLTVIDDYNPVAKAYPANLILNPNKPKFEIPLTGNQVYTSTTISDMYTGGKEKTEAYMDYDEFDGEFRVVSKKAYDKHNVLRHKWYREYYEDGCEYEEHSYYDCHGKLLYFGYSWYDEEGYEYKCKDEYYSNGEPISGYYYSEGFEGYQATYDPNFGDWVVGWKPELFVPENYVPDTSDCPDNETYWNHEFYLGPLLIREDDGGDGFNTFGGQFAYSKFLGIRGGLTGDIKASFGENFNTKYTKISALVGGTIFPVKTAALGNDFVFSLHALVGVAYLSSKYSGGTYSGSNSDANLSADLGIGAGYKLNGKLGISARIGYLPVFSKGNTAGNIGVSAGIVWK